MARNALLSALQAAMLAGAGGLQGSLQAQEREKKESERLRELETQALRDAILRSQLEMSGKNYELEQKKFEAQYGPEALARRDREAEENRAFQREQTRMTVGAASARDAAEREARTAQQRQVAEAWWNSITIPKEEQAAFNAAAQQGNPAAKARLAAADRATKAFDRIRRANPRMDPRDIFTSIYAAEQQFATEANRASQGMDERMPQANTTLYGGSASPSAPPAAAGASKYTDMQRAQRFEQLRAQGMSAADAQAQVLREMPR